jgi:hypothetical protein
MLFAMHTLSDISRLDIQLFRLRKLEPGVAGASQVVEACDVLAMVLAEYSFPDGACSQELLLGS